MSSADVKTYLELLHPQTKASGWKRTKNFKSPQGNWVRTFVHNSIGTINVLGFKEGAFSEYKTIFEQYPPLCVYNAPCVYIKHKDSSSGK